MSTKFSLSTNIIRDSDRDYQYVVTLNAQNAITNLIDDFNIGIHSSVIIGNYGTGKSTLLWAFEQSLIGKENYFDISKLKIKKSRVKILKFVGEYQSIINSFSEQLSVKNNLAGNQKIFDAIYQQYELVKKEGLLVILIDELGKFLEFAAKHEPEKELYFIQQLAEFVNHPDRKIILLTTLHQNFEAYSFGLNERQKNEWAKVRGRLKEVPFNEPIEQLLLMAADFIDANPAQRELTREIDQINKLTTQHKLFQVKQDFIRSIGVRLFPLDFISGYILTRAFQEYGQNERSLFTFLESKEFKTVRALKSNAYFNLVWLYDYLWANSYSLLNSSVNNRHYKAWDDIKTSIERAESLIEKETEDAIQIIKIIGLLNLFCSKGAKINNDFIKAYAETTCKIKNCHSILTELRKHKIILYTKYLDSYRLFEGTDVDIEAELLKAGKEVDEIVDVPAYLNKHVEQLPLITAKQVTYETGTPRLFSFVVSERPKKLEPNGEIDGYINIIINENISIEELREYSTENTDLVVYGLCKNSKKIKDHLIEIEKALKVKSENGEDTVVKRAMEDIVAQHQKLVRHYFIDSLYTENVDWFFRGQERGILSARQFNQWLSELVYLAYPNTPTYKNELVNRHKISGAVHTARKEFFEALVNTWSDGFLFQDAKFPPEKTIYISLLKENGLHRETRDGFALGQPNNDSSFIALWNACEEFLNSTRNEKRPITDLYEILLKTPYKLKQGLAEFWIPVFLFIKREDYALFGDNGYIPEINETVMLLSARNPEEYSIKAFNIEGVKLNLFKKYREFLKLSSDKKPNSESFIESIKPFLVFHRQLPEYSKNTTKLSQEAKAIRSAIAKSTDPERTFFEDFPSALRTSIKDLNESSAILSEYITRLKNAINELRNSYDDLLVRFESHIQNETGLADGHFVEYRKALQTRFKGLKGYMLLNYQKQFFQGINNPIDERNAWLSSLAQSIINKPLGNIRDDDEKVLFEKFITLLRELDNFTELSAIKSNSEKEKVFRFDITAEQYSKRGIVKIPKTKFAAFAKTEKAVRDILVAGDKQLSIAVLTKLLQEQLDNE